MLSIKEIQTLHRNEPLGIDEKPYFSWKLESDRTNVVQKSWRVTVTEEPCPANSEESALSNLKGSLRYDEGHTERIVWDSGIQDSSKQSFIVYDGEPLSSCTRYKVHVHVTAANGDEADGKSWFETAYLDPSDWKALWSESSLPRISEAEYKYGKSCPAVLFRKAFHTEEKKIVRARLYATSIGVYRVYLNEKRPDDREFAPEFTAYDHLLYYQTYDVTNLLKQGDNCLEFYVADGWYFSSQTCPVDGEVHEAPSVLFQMEIRYADGSWDMVSSGDMDCATGFICYSDLFQGEKQDFTRACSPWQKTNDKNYDTSILAAQPMDPVRPVQLVPAVEVFTSPAGETIVDFGQVLSGRARIHLNLPERQTAIFEYFEVLSAEGNYINTMFAPQKDTYVSDGKERDYEAFFTFHGFRYIRVTGMENVRKEDFTAVLLSTDKKDIGSFTCSDERVNRLYQNIRWSQASNMMSVPTDCPSREKAGWTGDILVYASTALENEDVTPFLTSWLRNLAAQQDPDGVVKITAPYALMYRQLLRQVEAGYGAPKEEGVAGWSDAIVWVPYEMYKATGNTEVLRNLYPAMEAWAQFIIHRAAERRGPEEIPEEYDRYLWNTDFHFGEWLIPSEPQDPKQPFEVCKSTAGYTAPFFGYRTISYMAEICAILGKTEKADHYRQTAAKMKHAIEMGIIRADRLPKHLMGAYILAFAFDLVPEELKDEYKKRLTGLIRDNHMCLNTGFLATPVLLDTLENIGEPQMARELFFQTKRPSWLYEVEHGATTIWEAWDADDAQKGGRYVSYDHYAFGCVDDWIFRHVAGIRALEPGYRKVRIEPDPACGLSSAKRTFDSEAGRISVSWNQEELKVEIPCNVTAQVVWKGQTSEVGSGSWSF